MRVITAILIAFVVSGCMSSNVLTVNETRDYYAHWVKGKPSGWGTMYYRGTDEAYHHFVCRPLDDWVFIRVKRGAIRVADERPVPTSADYRLYYYAVDPDRDFARIGGD